MVDQTTADRTTTPTSARTTNTNANESAPARSIRPTPSAHGGRRPRTPASASAVRDGRSLLAAFRNNKRRDDMSPHDATAVPADTNGSSGPSAAKSTDRKSTIDYVERYASRAPGLARNLEAALDASLSRRNTDEKGESVDSSEGNGGEATYNAPIHPAVVSSGPNGDAFGPSDGEIHFGHGDESSDSAASLATAAATTAAATATAVAATKPSPPRKDAISSSDGSPARPTPEVRGTALVSCFNIVGCDFEPRACWTIRCWQVGRPSCQQRREGVTPDTKKRAAFTHFEIPSLPRPLSLSLHSMPPFSSRYCGRRRAPPKPLSFPACYRRQTWTSAMPRAHPHTYNYRHQSGRTGAWAQRRMTVPVRRSRRAILRGQISAR